jgi:hypothetical protein
LSGESPKLQFMRNLSNDLPNLFTGDMPLAALQAESTREKETDRRPEQVAREFVKWCCGFGADFRNSPDLANLRFWCQKTKIKLKDVEQDAVLAEARRLFAKKVELITRKVDASLPQMNTMSE